MTDKKTKILPPPEQEVVDWNDLDNNNQRQNVSDNNDQNAPAPPVKMRVGVIGDNYLADACRISFDPKVTEVMHEKDSLGDLDQLCSWKPNTVFVCTDIGFTKKGQIVDDAEFINVIAKLSKHSEAGIIIKTAINFETINRIIQATDPGFVESKIVYSPEIGETVQDVLENEYVLLGGSIRATEAVTEILEKGTIFHMKEVIVSNIGAVIFTKLGLSAYKAVKQTLFNQFNEVITTTSRVNPTEVRRNMLIFPAFNDNTLAIPTFIRAQLDDKLSPKQIKSFKGEYQNKDVKLLLEMSDQLTILDDCINFKNVE